MTSSLSTDTINITSSTKHVIIKNFYITNPNPNGVVYVPSNSTAIITEYNNIILTGTKVSYNQYGTTRLINCNITIEETNGIASKEVAESNIIEISGTTLIQSSSVNSTLFLYKNTSNPTMTFLPNCKVNITTDTKELMTGTNNLIFNIQHDARVDLTTGNGFAPNPVYGASSVLISERATFNFLETKHQRVPMWTIYNSLTINEDAIFNVINSYENTPADNYNIHFKGTSPKLTINNPKSIVMYNKNANVFYVDNTIEFYFKISRINFWTSSTPLTNAGDIYNLPDYSWYKNDSLTIISGQATSTSTYVTNHNFTTEELNSLPSISNFHFQGKKQLSIGSENINIHPIDQSSTKISGHTTKFSNIQIKYGSTTEYARADEDGLFELDLENSLTDGTKIELISNNPSSFIYKTRSITTPHTGELSLMSSPSKINFLFEPIILDPITFPKTEDSIIKVIDSRKKSSTWQLYVHITNPLKSPNDHILLNALIFKTLTQGTIILNEVPSLVYTGNDTQGEVTVYDITYSKEKGLLLRLDNNPLIINEEYTNDIILSIKE